MAYPQQIEPGFFELGAGEPERQLIAAVLEQAARDLVGNQRGTARAAFLWLTRSPSAGWYARLLDIDPGQLQKRVTEKFGAAINRRAA